MVYTSFLGASPAATFPYARDHAHTEAAIRDAGLSLTALRDTLYGDTVPHLDEPVDAAWASRAGNPDWLVAG